MDESIMTTASYWITRPGPLARALARDPAFAAYVESIDVATLRRTVRERATRREARTVGERPGWLATITMARVRAEGE